MCGAKRNFWAKPSIVSIAFECGYEELSSFYRAFKKATGRSPGDWRAEQRV